LGWYAQVQEKLLRREGYDFEMLILDSPLSNWKGFAETMKRLSGGASWGRILRALHFGYRKMAALDSGDEIRRKLRAVERERGGADRLFDRLVRRVERAGDLRTVSRAFRDFREAAAEVETEETRPLVVRIVGEIWVVLEHSANLEIEEALGGDTLRVEVQRELSATHWFREHVLRDPRLAGRRREVIRAAEPYLSEAVGGHGQESVGETVLAAREGVDGVVHIFPFTCMPEIVAQNILVRVSEDLDIPVLTFIVSEQTGEAGMETRIEAFLDMLEERRRWRT
ncbi:MAG: acyl-CoA dehydratase activase-related protein, partial [Armatimonadota bacterium]